MYRPLYHLTILAVCTLFGSLYSCQGQNQSQHTANEQDSLAQRPEQKRWRIVLAGDIMTHGPQIQAAKQRDGSYDFTSNFIELQNSISSADIAIGNLETTFGGKPYTGYPQFSAPDQMAVALRQVGFDILGTSNNHSADRGKLGITRTLDVLDSVGIRHVGSYRSAEERGVASPLIYNAQDLRLAVLAYTYGTNGIPVPSPTIVDPIDTALIRRDVARADSLGAQYKMILIHWGEEYQKHPNNHQRELAQYLHRLGVDAIIGSHPHVVQSSEMLTDSLTGHQSYVIYSLGNFISNQRTPAATRGGMLLTLDLERSPKGSISTKPSYQWVFVNKKNKQGQAIYKLLPIDIYSDSIPSALPPTEAKEYQAFRQYYLGVPQYQN